MLQEQFGACQISTGDILRKAVAEQTSLGREAAKYIQGGALVPDSVIVNLVAERLKKKDCEKGFILDGFPRTIPQAESLEAILKTGDLALDSVLSLRLPHSVIVERLAGRRTCKNCGALKHVVFDPPKRQGICDRCGGELYQREDDREETVATRLKVYDTQTAPLEDFYRERGLLRQIDGAGTVEDIRNRIDEIIGDRVQ